ncbi:hypothetical protein FRC19_000072 [Serendipita sp. 401]|nr:hypothetical protein FRC16_004417 [Serendipita sp. 398]KAG8828684.1 hypothetical protein FRC19_000072 [Serendipita sp. 401]KAG9058865.1 hypothetical protein FS842_000062 [Serendipita sp. 407]
MSKQLTLTLTVLQKKMSSTDWDLLLVTDATASMGTYLEGLAVAIPEILSLGKLSGAFSRVGLLAYTDYSEGPEIEDVIQWFGWNNPEVTKEATRLSPQGGGDTPEACKTALAVSLQHVDPERRTLILWYADAGPHHSSNGGGYYSNGPKEKAALVKEGFETDWVKLSRQAKEKNCLAFPIIQQGMAISPSRFFALLAAFTDGTVFTTPARESSEISQLTLDLLLAWMGEKLSPPKYKTEIVRFKKNPAQASVSLTDEEAGSRGYCPTKQKAKLEDLETIPLTTLENAQFDVVIQLPNLSKKFLDPKESQYRKQVYEALKEIIGYNVVALTYNPIFGQLWRAVCKDRTNPYREELVNAFSNKVGKESDENRRKMLTDWLEESYNAEEEIMELVNAAPDSNDPKQPRIYLDLDSGIDLTRTELLEVARSLYPGVLKKLASILTHLKTVEEDVTLLPNQRYLPLSLKPFDLFRVLPHLVVPGTMFSGRAAALFAALAMRVGVPFLDKPARALLSNQKGTWLDLEIPENLSYECAKLLTSIPTNVALTADECQVYQGMRRYRLIELNLKASLTASVPWTPEKTGDIGDQQLACKICSKRRSVTIMADDGTCGLCAYERERANAISKHVKGAKDLPIGTDDGVEVSEKNAKWVECSVPTCRAQYVVLRPGQLRVRPKCHHCRYGSMFGTNCPWVQCQKCDNRVIIPESLRAMPKEQFICFACQGGKKTIVDVDTNTGELVAENGRDWLGYDAKYEIFRNSSAFKLFSRYGPEVFTGEPVGKDLTLHFKKIFNCDALRLKIEGRVASGEVEQGTCSLCFDDVPYHKLFPACGRSGCKQQADEECLQRWYGENKPGNLLNPLQLRCPFCRRPPVHKMLIKYNNAALSVGDLAHALEDRAWYYAWCITCGFAKPAVERACADNGLPRIREFVCGECTAEREALEARLRAEAAALEARLREETARRQEQDGGRARARLQALNEQIRIVDKNKVSKITPCPRCGVYVEKMYGCNHITCTCGAHFCFIDGLEFSENTIYDHLNKKHGGIGYDDGDSDEE